MATRKKANYKLRDKLCYELADAHRQFHRLKLRWSILHDRRVPFIREASEKLTREDYGFVCGYARALWDASWNVLVWKLGHENSTEALPSRTAPEQGGWNYKTGAPTFGGHFHATGELATDWLPFATNAAVSL